MPVSFHAHTQSRFNSPEGGTVRRNRKAVRCPCRSIIISQEFHHFSLDKSIFPSYSVYCVIKRLHEFWSEHKIFCLHWVVTLAN